MGCSELRKDIMIDRVVERLLNSFADASYWVLIILAIGFVGAFLVKRVVDFLLTDVKTSKGEE